MPHNRVPVRYVTGRRKWRWVGTPLIDSDQNTSSTPPSTTGNHLPNRDTWPSKLLPLLEAVAGCLGATHHHKLKGKHYSPVAITQHDQGEISILTGKHPRYDEHYPKVLLPQGVLLDSNKYAVFPPTAFITGMTTRTNQDTSAAIHLPPVFYEPVFVQAFFSPHERCVRKKSYNILELTGAGK